jgi:hypothetical protein
MKSKAILMALAMMTTALAGCTGTDGVTEVDEDALNELIDANLQDFINNTTIVVNNHYHNNTTVNNYDTTNEYDNTTNVDGGEVNNYNSNNYSIGGGGAMGNGTGGTLYLLDIQFNLLDLMPDYEEIDHRNNTFEYTYQYYDGLINDYRTDVFTVECIDYYLVGSQSANGTAYNYWQSSSNYADLWANLYNQTYSNLLQEAAYDQWSVDGLTEYQARLACDENYNITSGYYGLSLFEIPIPAGTALGGFYDGYFQGIEEYVWSHEEYGYNYHNGDYNWYGYGEMQWRENFYPESWYYSYPLSAFDVDFEFETMDWSYSHGGWVGGDEDSVLTVSVNNIWPGYEYRLIAYFSMAPVIPLE